MAHEQKIKSLAGWSTRFRNGVAEMVKAGHDPEELDELIAEAEEQVAEENKARKKRERTRRLVKDF